MSDVAELFVEIAALEAACRAFETALEEIERERERMVREPPLGDVDALFHNHN